MVRDTLRASADIARRNYLLFAPTIGASLLVGIIGWIVQAATRDAAAQVAPTAQPLGVAAWLGTTLWIGALVGILGAVITLVGHGMTVAMAAEAVDGKSPTLQSSFAKVRPRIVALLLTALAVGALTVAGTLLLILPGLIVAFFLMFSFVALISDDVGVATALRRSATLVWSKRSESVVLFLVLFALGILFGIVSGILGLIPVAGPLLNVILGGLYVGLTTVMLVHSYRGLSQSESEAGPTAHQA